MTTQKAAKGPDPRVGKIAIFHPYGLQAFVRPADLLYGEVVKVGPTQITVSNQWARKRVSTDAVYALVDSTVEALARIKAASGVAARFERDIADATQHLNDLRDVGRKAVLKVLKGEPE